MSVKGNRDEVAFECFVRSSGPSLLRTALLLTGDRGHAEDLLQNALERTARHWSRLNGSPEAYARRAVVNGATDRRRRLSARVVEIGLSTGLDETQDDQTCQVDLRDALMAALRSLPPRQSSVLICRYVLDLDERQTADALGVGMGTVKASTSRGLSTLRLLAPDFELTAAPHGARP